MPLQAGQHIGPYSLLEPLGSGGMGEVWLAERIDGGYKQQVAIKLMQAFRQTKGGMRRFARERQILASLQHPGIASLLGGGITSDGQPYYVMEYVEGVSITHYCKKNDLSLPQRLCLFQQACAAVRYAHQKLIIHSDLKPEHILVDSDGHIKLLDFGLARLQEKNTNSATIEKQLFTPAYASPEQVKGEALTTATDIYSLGVVLYEILTGESLFDLENKTALQALRIITETQIEKPSIRVEPERIHKIGSITSELDTICLKALDKQPEMRYASVEAFSEDIDRYAVGLPISAKPKSHGYVLKKYLQRNALVVLPSAAIILTIFLTVMFYTFRLQQEQQEAFSQLKRAETLSGFLQGLFDTNNRRGNYATDITAKKLVDNGARRIESELKGQPKEKVLLTRTIGRVYRRLGLLHPAKDLLKKGLDLTLQHYSEDSFETIESRQTLADALYYTGKYVEAESLLTVTLKYAGNNRLSEYSPKKHCEVLNLLGKIQRRLRKDEEAMLLYEKALQLAEAVDDMDQRLTSMNNLATSYSRSGRLEEAEQMYNELMPLAKEYHGEYHPQIAIVANNLGALYRRTGRLDEAKKLYEESLWRRERIYGDNHPGLCLALSNLAGLHMTNGDLETSIKLLRRSVKISKDSHGPAHPYVKDNLRRIVKNLTDLQRFEEAERALQELTDITNSTVAKDHFQRARLERTAARFYRKKNDMDKAEMHYRAAVTVARKAYPPGNYRNYVYIYSMARLLQDRKRYSEAESFFMECLELIEKNPERLQKRQAALLKYLIKLYESLARPIEVEKYTELLNSSKTDNPRQTERSRK
ncbi:MAG: tetratricopeptide repeat protein [Calditrichia bacterium]